VYSSCEGDISSGLWPNLLVINFRIFTIVMDERGSYEAEDCNAC
jgi:hypothetical protein